MNEQAQYQQVKPDGIAIARSPHKYLVRVEYLDPMGKKKSEHRDFVQWHNIKADIKNFFQVPTQERALRYALGAFVFVVAYKVGFRSLPLFLGSITADTSANGQNANSNGGARSFSYTMSAGSGGIITAAIIGAGGNASGFNSPSLTYNAVSLTNVDSSNSGNNSYLYNGYLQSPATGANTFGWSINAPTSNSDQAVIVMSFTGALTSGSPIDGHFITGGSSSNAISIGNSNSMIVQWIQAGISRSFSQGSTPQGFTIANRGAYYSSNYYAPASTGSITLGLSGTANDWAAFGILPAPNGPTGLKTFDTVAAASISTIDTVSLGSVKSINTVT